MLLIYHLIFNIVRFFSSIEVSSPRLSPLSVLMNLRLINILQFFLFYFSLYNGSMQGGNCLSDSSMQISFRRLYVVMYILPRYHYNYFIYKYIYKYFKKICTSFKL
jgi:hypothetical protein